eukprot:4002-Rhodomonas_salina.1
MRTTDWLSSVQRSAEAISPNSLEPGSTSTRTSLPMPSVVHFSLASKLSRLATLAASGRLARECCDCLNLGGLGNLLKEASGNSGGGGGGGSFQLEKADTVEKHWACHAWHEKNVRDGMQLAWFTDRATGRIRAPWFAR